MRQEDISFRHLLERVLPLHELPPPDRLRVQRVLQHGVAEQLEAAALLALERLEARGALERLPTTTAPDGARVVRYQPRGGLEIISLRYPAPAETGGLIVYPRAALPAHAQATLDQVRKLLRLDEPLLSGDPREGGGRLASLAHLDGAGRELVGEGEFRFYPAAPDEGDQLPDTPLDAELARQAAARPGHVFYCPDAWAHPRLAAEARRRQVRSLVTVGAAASTGDAIGHLEVRSPEPARFNPQDLALVTLLADHCAAILERAARIEQMVFIDPTTGAYNRSYFDLQLQNEIARAQRERESLALCIVDIDDFKAFNTAFGYQAGNEVLVRVAQTLRHGVRPFDTVARWGGEEFGVLLTAPLHSEDVRAVCERLRAAVERLPVHLEGLDRRLYEVAVTVSMGVAVYPQHADNAPDLWRAANQALLEAKLPPKNRIVVAAPPPPTA